MLRGKLEAARADFMRLEKDYGDGTRANDDLADAYFESQENYEEVRAEYVADDIVRYVREETEVLRSRTEAKEPKGAFERLHQGWKWLSEKNLSKVFDPDSKILKVGARMVNLRTAVGGALLGIAWAIPGAQIGVVAARQLLAGAGTTFLAYELQRRRAEVKAIDLKNLEELSPNEVAEKFHTLHALAKLKGSWEGLEGAYGEVRARYEELMAVAVGFGIDLQEYTWERVEAEEKKEHARKWRSVGAGALGMLGFAALRHVVKGGEVGHYLKGMFKTPTTEHLASQGLLHSTTPEADVLLGGHGVSAEKVIGTLRGAEAIQEGAEIPVTFQAGEGPIHEARKALALYLAEHADPSTRQFSPVEKIWAEERL